MVDIKKLMECSEIHEETLRFDSPSFDTAIVGIDYFGRLIYDYDRMIAELMEADNITDRSIPYYGEYAPIVLIRNLYNE